MNLIVIMAGGLTNDLKLPSWVLDRIKYCEEILTPNDVILASSSFTLNIPPKLNKKNFIISEASVIRNELINRKIKNEIHCEQLSHDTVGSVYFTLKFYIDYLKPNKVIWITSDFHLKKVKYLVEKISKVVQADKIEMECVGIKSVQSTVRFQKEYNDLINLKNIYDKINNEDQLKFEVLFKHDNYNYKFGSKELTNLKKLKY